MIKHRQEKRPLRLLLSSYGFNSPIMRDKFAKVLLQDESLCKKTCMVIPYAGFDVEKPLNGKNEDWLNLALVQRK